jgi:D-alanyl-D-alanine carboxypeptidase (penicillin-binding protein 5/6)
MRARRAISRTSHRTRGERRRPHGSRRAIAIATLTATLCAASAGPQPALAVRPAREPAARSASVSPAELAWPAEGEAAVTVPGVGGLGTSGPATPVPIASVAKIMTAFLTLREHPLRGHERGFKLTITATDVADEQRRAALGESVLPVRAGERLSERQALQALLVPSANNVAELLAVHDAGSAPAFVARMNATARRLGMRATTYTDPSGYDADTVSSAADQLRLAIVAMRRPVFAALVAEPAVDFPVAGRLTNYDALVGHDGYVGIKTGSDGAAGGCFVFAKRVTVAGRHLLVVGAVLDQRAGAYVQASLDAARRLGDSAAVALRRGLAVPVKTAALAGHGLTRLL